MANLTTRISLRNDVLSNWTTSDVQLNKGEVALARLSGELSDKFEMRIGVGGKTWNELSDGGIMIPASNVFGLTDAISELSTSFYETTDINELTGTYVNGDIAVEKKDIDGTHEQYTAYRWSKVNGVYKWAALDGNYSAENVYFTNDIVMTYPFGKYNGSDSSSVTLSSKGHSLQEVLADALATKKQPTVTSPSISFTFSGGTGEIGTTYTVADGTMTFSPGSYTYGPDTGVTVPATSAMLSTNAGSNHTPGLSVSNPGILNKTNNTLTVDNTLSGIYLSGGTTYTLTATASYTAGTADPKTNTGAKADVAKIAAGSTSNSKTATYTGYYPAYWGFSTAPTANPTAVTANNGNVAYSAGLTLTRELNSFSKTSFASPGKWYELFYLVPTAKQTKTKWSGKDSNNLTLAAEDSTLATVTFKDNSTAQYRVFVVRNAVEYAKTTCNMTFAN